MNPFTRLTLSRILTPLCKPVHSHRLAAFDWSDDMSKKVELAADPVKAAQAALAAQKEEEAEKQARAAQLAKDAIGDFGL